MNVFLDQPVFWIPFLGVLIASLAFFGSFQSRGVTRVALMFVAVAFIVIPGYILTAVFAPNLIDARIRTYWSFYDAIEINMTREQVLSTLEKHYPHDGQRQRPKIMKDNDNSLGFFMNPEYSQHPNCEGVFLDLAEGKVIRKRYSKD